MRPTLCSPAGIQLIKEYEGCALQAYRCPAGIWTIGYGSTSNVTPDMKITKADAVRRLSEDIDLTENVVYKQIKVPLSQNQFDALCCLVFNIGAGNFALSTLKRLLNEKKYVEASMEFLRWDKVKGVSSPGLKRRRIAEYTLFRTKDGDPLTLT